MILERAQSLEIAQDTMRILKLGGYTRPSGGHYDLRADIARAVAGSVQYQPQQLAALPLPLEPTCDTGYQVTNETTLMAAARLCSAASDEVMCLNFASATSAGGGFLSGARAQEESIARSSTLYPTLRQHDDFYAAHIAARDSLYSDRMIYSPQVTVFKDDPGNLLETPQRIALITSAAPMAYHIRQYQPHDYPRLATVIAQRAERVLALARHRGHSRLVLGAWGCGAFGNDVELVSGIFAGLLLNGGPFHGAFAEVVFAVYDTREGLPFFKAFHSKFSNRGAS